MKTAKHLIPWTMVVIACLLYLSMNNTLSEQIHRLEKQNELLTRELGDVGSECLKWDTL